jgi:DNA-binding Lrp family transcriptional regulator
MLLSNGEVDCTLTKYRNESGEIVKEVVIPPETVKDRMHKRLNRVEDSLNKRLDDVQKELSDMINMDKKPVKNNLKKLLHEIVVIRSNLSSNREFVVQETERELGEMQSNMVGQLGLFIQGQTGEVLPGESLKKLLQVSDGPLLIGESIEPVIDKYTPKTHQCVTTEEMATEEVTTEEMTPTKLASNIMALLKIAERCLPKNSDDGLSHPYTLVQANGILISYIDYRGSTILSFEEARKYLKFLNSITHISEFKRHYNYKG